MNKDQLKKLLLRPGKVFISVRVEIVETLRQACPEPSRRAQGGRFIHHRAGSIEADLWHAADSLRTNFDLKANEYSTPALGLIFLKFADNKYRQHEAAVQAVYKFMY